MTHSVVSIPASQIVPGNNPRKYFDPGDLCDLVASVRSKGVLQPILVRPLPSGSYQLIAGERRWRAVLEIHGPEGTVPAIVRDVDDGEAQEMSLVENAFRADMSPGEEAEAAHNLLQYHGGDREETARRLGWTVSTLDRRVALMGCAPEVRKALAERKILLGHAELLAAVPHEKQVGTLDKIVEHNLPVSFVRDKLLQIAQSLAGAVFDRKDCATCAYSSSRQASLFAETISEGYCTNGECFDRKTSGRIAELKAEFEQEVPCVRIIEAGDAGATAKIQATGNLGVGEEQARACRGCTNYGLTISMLPGKVGEIERDICFNQACYQGKVSERIRSERKDRPASTPVAATGKVRREKPGKAVGVHISQRVKDYRKGVWQRAAARDISSRPDQSLSFLIALCLSGKSNCIGSSKLAEAFRKLSGVDVSSAHDLEKAGELVDSTGKETHRRFLPALAGAAPFDLQEHDLVKAMRMFSVDLSRHWKLNEEFLKLLTKSEIEAVCEEVGLKSRMGDAFGKALGGKKEDAIKTLLAVDGFDYAVVPGCMRYDAENTTHGGCEDVPAEDSEGQE